MLLDDIYWRAASTPSDISELVPVLHKYASTVDHVTEFGARAGNSTSAFLFARPRTVISYDLVRDPRMSELEKAAMEAGIDFRFRQEDIRSLKSIETTDLLFIDSLHVMEQMAVELRHASSVRRFILLHDTELFGIRGEGGRIGIWPAVAAFLKSQPEWEIAQILLNNNGLTILRRRNTLPFLVGLDA